MECSDEEEDSENGSSKMLKKALKVTYIKNRRYIRMPNFSKKAVVVLKRWFQEHIDSPYPTHKEKVAMSKESGLTKR